MAEELKSFKKDWNRWSLSERLFAAFFVAASTLALLGGDVPGLTQ